MTREIGRHYDSQRKTTILTLLSFELQKWLSSQNWSEFNQESISVSQQSLNCLRPMVVRSRLCATMQRPLNCLNSESFPGNQFEEKNKRILFESLVVNTSTTNRSDDLFFCAPNDPGKFISQGQGYSVQSSPYENIDQLVKRLASPGNIRKVVFNDEKQTVRYDVTGNTFCRTKGGNHRKSNIYYKYFAIWNKLIQDCYSQHCKFKKVVEIEIN